MDELDFEGKSKKLLKRFAAISVLVIAVAGIFLFGVYLGFQNRPAVSRITELVNKEEGLPAGVDFSPFWKTWSILNQRFVSDNGAVDEQEKVWGAIKGLVDSYGDPYTTFMPPVEAKMFDEDISGNFGGVGMEIGMKDGVITVVAPLKNTPADQAGIKAGDKIIEIDGKITSGVSVDEAVRLIRGESGTEVVLLVIHPDTNEPIEISITRGTIEIPTIDTELRADGVFVISLYNFSANSPNLFRDALREFIESETDKLVLDLRGNPGGYLDAAVDMASFFLPAGKAIVREDFGEKEEEVIYRSRGYDIFNENLKMVVLIDGGSASASEILAGALSEHSKAKLVGTKTFGKGSVQELLPITSDTSLKVTVARWLTPNGKSISKEGLMPDYVVEITEADITGDRDPQMEKAVQILLGKI